VGEEWVAADNMACNLNRLETRDWHYKTCKFSIISSRLLAAIVYRDGVVSYG
jgi:hypothetical protein